MTPYRDTITQLSTLFPSGEASALVRMLFEVRFGLTQTDLLLGKDSNLSEKDTKELHNIVERLLKNEPIQYILGECEFCGLNIGVAPGVLIPRPETQELVEWICEECRPQPTSDTLQEDRQPDVLDIGTGSGCIALSLAHRGFNVEAWDVSNEALHIAKQNAKQLDLNIRFELKDILQIKETEREYSVIVSNPPYICQHEASSMERNVLDHEPHLALFVPDDDPLLFYRAIACFAQKALIPDGHLFFEINRAYSRDTAEMLSQLGFNDIKIKQDQFGNPRMVKATKPHTQPASPQS